MTSVSIPSSKQRLTELVALLVFFIITFPLCMPCLCVGGVIRGFITTAFASLVFCRLAWQVHKRTFSFKDYFAYLLIVVGFCVWAETQT